MDVHSAALARITAFGAAMLLVPGVAGAATPTVTEFALPSAATQPQGIAAGPDGNLWFTELGGVGGIGRITTSGVITEFRADTQATFTDNSAPVQIAAGADGNMWFTENAANKIGRITPAGVVSEFSAGLTASAGLQGIAQGPDGNMWFAENSIGKLGRITPSGTISEFTIPFATPGPIGVAEGPAGKVWFADANRGALGSATTGITPTITETGVGVIAGDDPTELAPDALASMWFTDFNTGRIGFTDPLAGTDNLAPVAGLQPRGITSGPDGNMWFAETGHNLIGRVNEDQSVPTELGAGQITGTAAPFEIATGPDGNLWFTEEGTGKIGRITTAVDPPAFTAPARIAVPGTGTQGPASPYPSTIDVSGLSGTVTSVRARLNGVFHAKSSDVDALLVGPQGQSALLVASANPPGVSQLSATGAVMTFADGGETMQGQFVSGIFAPRNFGPQPTFPAPAPAGPYGTALSTFSGTDPNGQWKLFVNDPASNDAGEIVGGWSLDIDTLPPQTIDVPGPTVTLPATPDTRNPEVTISKVPRKLRLKSFLKGFSMQVTPDEPAAIDVTLTGTSKRTTLAAVPVVLFHKSFGASASTQVLKVRPSRGAVGTPRKAVKVLLDVTATDRGGNVTQVDSTIKVAPDKKR